MILSIGKPDPLPGAKLKALFERHPDAGQVKAGKAYGVKQTSVSRIHAGKQALTTEVAAAAASFYGVRAGWLLFDEGPPHEDAPRAYLDGRTAAFGEVSTVALRLADKAPQIGNTADGGPSDLAARMRETVARLMGQIAELEALSDPPPPE